MIEASSNEGKHTVYISSPNDRFDVYKGRDIWHKDIAVQIRLEPDGHVFVSVEKHMDRAKSATIFLEELHLLIKNYINK